MKSTKDKGVIEISIVYPGNLVTIATRNVADAYHLNEPPHQI